MCRGHVWVEWSCARPLFWWGHSANLPWCVLHSALIVFLWISVLHVSNFSTFYLADRLNMCKSLSSGAELRARSDRRHDAQNIIFSLFPQGKQISLNPEALTALASAVKHHVCWVNERSNQSSLWFELKIYFCGINWCSCVAVNSSSLPISGSHHGNCTVHVTPFTPLTVWRSDEWTRVLLIKSLKLAAFSLIQSAVWLHCFTPIFTEMLMIKKNTTTSS